MSVLEASGQPREPDSPLTVLGELFANRPARPHGECNLVEQSLVGARLPGVPPGDTRLASILSEVRGDVPGTRMLSAAPRTTADGRLYTFVTLESGPALRRTYHLPRGAYHPLRPASSIPAHSDSSFAYLPLLVIEGARQAAPAVVLPVLSADTVNTLLNAALLGFHAWRSGMRASYVLDLAAEHFRLTHDIISSSHTSWTAAFRGIHRPSEDTLLLLPSEHHAGREQVVRYAFEPSPIGGLRLRALS